MIELTHDKIENDSLLPDPADVNTGATVAFLGTAREFTADRQTQRLEYEAYAEMVSSQGQALVDAAHQRWPDQIRFVRIVHRLGVIELGETCVAVVVSCPHRKQAFEAAAWIMDRIKETIPIWKKEIWAEGGSDWVHADTP